LKEIHVDLSVVKHTSKVLGVLWF